MKKDNRVQPDHGLDEMPYEDLFNAMVHEAPVSMYILNGWQYSYVNQQFCELTGYEEAELVTGGVTFEDMIHPEDLSAVRERIAKEYDIQDASARYRVRVYRKNGELRYVEIHSTKKYWQGKNVLFGTVVDVTAEIEANLQLKEKEERLHSLFDYNPDAVFTFDLDGHFQSANPGCEVLTGYSIEELLQLSFIPLIVSEDLNMALLQFDDAIRGMARTYELAITRKDGHRRNLLINNFPMKSGGNIVGTWGIAKDITDKIKHEKLMEELVFFDPLTRLPNRKLFEDRLKQVFEMTGCAANLPAVLYLDLNRFKFINDSFGHQCGDELLQKIAQRLVDTVDRTETVGRFAGDEFAILIPDLDQAGVFRLAERLIDSLAVPIEVMGQSFTTSASMGIAFSGGPGETVDGLIKKADTAMYCTKKHKIQPYTVYSEELDQQTAYHMNIERELKSAIANQELVLHYQPITDLTSGRLSAMEALIRWHHPELGMVPPDHFIPISEQSGQIVPIGRWVLHTACTQNKAWQNEGYPAIKICVNISTIQLKQPNFVQTVKAVLQETGLEAKWLELEVTESILLEDTAVLKDSLHSLTELGVSLSIDDFGTGYTSLSYLRQFAFDRVKIDRSFVEDISNERNGKAITATIISLAHKLNMMVVAEGIEDDIQLAFLQGEKCDEGQGYYFSRPLPAEMHDLGLWFNKDRN